MSMPTQPSPAGEATPPKAPANWTRTVRNSASGALVAPINWTADATIEAPDAATATTSQAGSASRASRSVLPIPPRDGTTVARTKAPPTTVRMRRTARTAAGRRRPPLESLASASGGTAEHGFQLLAAPPGVDTNVDLGDAGSQGEEAEQQGQRDCPLPPMDEHDDPEEDRQQPGNGPYGPLACFLAGLEGDPHLDHAGDDGPGADPDHEHEGGDVRPNQGDDAGGDV